MVEFFLFLLLSYLLVLGLFVSHQLTNQWLWVSAGYTLIMFNLMVCDFKNLIFFNLSVASINWGIIFVGSLLIGTSFIVWSIKSSFVRDLIGWVLFWLATTTSQHLWYTTGGSTYTVSDLVYWSGFISGGSLFHDLRFLILLILLLTVVSTYQSFNYYSYNYLVLLLLASLSGLLLLQNDNLIVTYLNLEFQALTLYILTTYYRFEESQTEAGLKYLLIGSLVSGFFLLGTIVIYQRTGSLNVSELTLPSNTTWVLATLIFKLGAAPFYFWTPSVYQTLDYTTLLFVSSLPKISTWYLLLVNFNYLQNQLLYYSGLLSIVIGAYSGLYQLRLPSIIAYSGVLNSGYLLVVLESTGETHFMISTYLVGYYLSLALLLASLQTVNTIRYTLLGGFLFYYLMLSVGGLPVVPGFSFKIYLLSFVLERSLMEGILIILSSLCSMMYYLRVSGQYLFTGLTLTYQPPTIVYQIIVFCFGLNVTQSLTTLIGAVAELG